jgi:hypothetical protein
VRERELPGKARHVWRTDRWSAIGSRWRGPEEEWAAKQKIWYGHLHVHLLFPTVTVRTKAGEHLTVIEQGRLTALDDPEVRELARKHGDPDELLRENWIPAIPGISAAGSYEEFARNPAPVVYGRARVGAA